MKLAKRYEITGYKSTVNGWEKGAVENYDHDPTTEEKIEFCKKHGLSKVMVEEFYYLV